MSGFELARYVLSIRSPEVVPAEEGSAYKWDLSDQRLLANLPAMIEAAQENLQDLMPEGYTVTLSEDKPPEDWRAGLWKQTQ